MGKSPYLSESSFQLSPRDQRHHLDKEQKTANILGRREKGGLCSDLQEWNWVGRCAKKEPIGADYSLQCVAAEIYEYRSGEMWGNFTAGIVCHSPRLSVWSLPPQRLFHLPLSHTHTLNTHTYTPPPALPKETWCWGVPLPKKVTGVPIGNPKIKGPLFLLYVMIPCLCLALCKLLISEFDWEYSSEHNVECEIKI